jgi:hypothetical protein
MAQFWLDMDRSEAELQAEWNLDNTAVTKITADGSPAIRVKNITDSGYSGAVWNVSGVGITQLTQCEVYCKMKSSSGSSIRYGGPGFVDNNGEIARGIFAVARVSAVNDYTLFRRGTSLVDVLDIYDGPDNTAAFCQRVYVELTAENANPLMRWKVWAPGDSEPLGFRYDDTQAVNGVFSDPTLAGAGVLIRNNWSVDVDLIEFGVGTDGDPAPTGPVGGVSTEPFLLRHNPRTNKVVPVLSSPTVTDLGATCVRPRVTKGF